MTSFFMQTYRECNFLFTLNRKKMVIFKNKYKPKLIDWLNVEITYKYNTRTEKFQNILKPFLHSQFMTC